MLNNLIFIAALVLGIAPVSSQAKIIQILHTNDLHASLHSKGAPMASEPEFGGWAQIKTVMDRLTAEAKANKIPGNEDGIETIRLDAGDFSEGTLHYFPDRGEHVLRAFQAIGYDAVTLGNHDWLMGATALNEVMGRARFNDFIPGSNLIAPPLLAANAKISPSLKNLNSQILPARQLTVDGVKIGIFGLTTDEAFYKWITKVDSGRRDMKIEKYLKIAKKMAAELQANNDMVIALTHIGFSNDRSLAKKVNGIDLIVGGHSHTLLESLAVVNNPKGQPVPIVQAGYNGAFIGRLFVEVVPGLKPKVLTYEAVPVLNSEAKDPMVDALIQDAESAVVQKFKADQLNKKIGTSEVRLVSGSQGPTAFAKFAADSMKEVTGADIAVDIGSFHGNTAYPAGVVTKRTLMEMYPRKFESNQDEGWYVYRAKVPGWVIKLAVKYAVNYGVYFSMGGVSFDVERMTDEEFDAEVAKRSKEGKFTTITPYRAKNILVGGQKIKPLKRYSIATPEGLIRGAYGITKLTHLIIRKGASTGITIWDAMEKYLSKIGVIQRINPGLHFNGKEFAPTYQDYQQELQEEQNMQAAANEGEAIKLKWTDDRGREELDNAELFQQFLKEVDQRAATEDTDIED